LGAEPGVRVVFSRAHRTVAEVIAMLDVAMIALGVGFFAASVLYVLACERM
jgi:hypothetical protein